MDRRHTLERVFLGRPVQVAFVFLLGVWAVLETGWLPEAWYGPLYPVWFPWYLAATAAGFVEEVLPALGTGPLLYAAIGVLTYVEAVLLAGAFRTARRVYRTYQRGRRVGNHS